jgi:hypothetical protein
VLEFKDKDGNVYRPKDEDTPYGRIDVIFNDKNIWANFQNPSPNFIFYNLHRRTQWCPLIIQENENGGKKKQKKEIKSNSDSSGEGKLCHIFNLQHLS